MHPFLLTPASQYGCCWVPMTGNLDCVINVWVTEAVCTESHSELKSALCPRSWLEEEERLVLSMRKVLKGQDVMTSRVPSRSTIPSAETLFSNQLHLLAH